MYTVGDLICLISSIVHHKSYKQLIRAIQDIDFYFVQYQDHIKDHYKRLDVEFKKFHAAVMLCHAIFISSFYYFGNIGYYGFQTIIMCELIYFKSFQIYYFLEIINHRSELFNELLCDNSNTELKVKIAFLKLTNIFELFNKAFELAVFGIFVVIYFDLVDNIFWIGVLSNNFNYELLISELSFKPS